MEQEKRILAIRSELEAVDRALLELVERRMELSREVGAIKRENGLPIYDPARERALFALYEKSVANPENFDYAKAIMLSLLRASKREQRRGLNVYLIGMPGSGKSALAKEAARAVEKNAMDTDEMVELEAGMRIAELFASCGEAEFRRLEANMLKRAAVRGYSVVATGGGVLTTPQNLALMKGSGRVVLLDRSLEELLKQDTSGRPLLARGKADIQRLYRERRAAYLGAADFIIDPDEKDALALLIDYCGE